MSDKHRITVTVNGKVYERQVEPRLTLVDLLRQELQLTGTHVGCEHGICGACTVMIDGRAARSCLALAVQADGAEVTTIEGLRERPGGRLHPVQQAFVDAHGMQCGFCTPGMIMSTVELLAAGSDPSDAQIKEALGGNLCRCTGYQSIIAAVRLAAQRLHDGG